MELIMKQTVFILTTLFLSACGFNGTQKVETNDSEQKIIQEGSSFTYVIVRLEYLEDIKNLCIDANPSVDFATEEAQKKAIAECTLEHMNVLSIDLNQIDDFNEDYCKEDADLSALTPEQQADVAEACALLPSEL
jgi:hypothetical protein